MKCVTLWFCYLISMILCASFAMYCVLGDWDKSRELERAWKNLIYHTVVRQCFREEVGPAFCVH